MKLGKKIKKIREVLKNFFNNLLFFLKLKKDPNFFFNEISGIIHVGANEGQEREKYDKYSLSVVWVEPIPEIFKKLTKNIENYKKQKAFNFLLSNEDNKEIKLNISNNDGLSSSIFDIGLHSHIWPKVNYVNSIKLRSMTLATLIKDKKIDIKKYQALVLDTQGSELLILKGASEILDKFKYILTEAADFDSYVGCCKLEDLSDYLLNFGFKEITRTKFAKNSQVGNYYDVIFEKQN